MIMHYLHTLGPLGEGVIKKRLKIECGFTGRKAGQVVRVFNQWKQSMEAGRLSAFDLSPAARRSLAGRKIRSVTDLQTQNMLHIGWQERLPKPLKAEIKRLMSNLGLDEL